MTAHHLNDVVETFLMRMTRGTSIRICIFAVISAHEDPSGHTVMPTIRGPLLGGSGGIFRGLC